MFVPVLLGVVVGAGVGLVADELFGSRRKKSRRQSSSKSWQKTEKEVCESRGVRHRGGPGRADCGRTIEVKAWSRPVDSSTVLREARKGRKTIVAPGGFTKPARKAARQAGVRLAYR